MLETLIRFDLRSPFETPAPVLYGAALEMAAWADRVGVDTIMVSEHHGTDDGYCPSPVVLAAAFAARTTRIRLRYAAALVPLHDPIAVAEEIAVLDLISGGRCEVVIGAGYIPLEFAMFGASLRDRGRLVEERTATITRALEGEPLERHGATFRVTPRPVQRPRPPILMAGSVPASALRAARLCDGFYPMLYDADLVATYQEECRRLGKEPGRVINASIPVFIHVSDDPERTWSIIGRHALYELNSYFRWTAQASSRDMRTVFTPVEDLEALKLSGLYRVVTPDECVELARQLDEADATFMIHPLMAGMPPEVGWENLELLEKLLPQLPGRCGVAS